MLTQREQEVIKNSIIASVNMVDNMSIHCNITFTSDNNYFDYIEREIDKNIKGYGYKKFSIDLTKEDIGFDEIDENGDIVLPSWLKNSGHTFLLLRGIDEISNRSRNFKYINSIIKDSVVRGIDIPIDKHIVILTRGSSNLKYLSKHNMLDVKLNR